ALLAGFVLAGVAAPVPAAAANGRPAWGGPGGGVEADHAGLAAPVGGVAGIVRAANDMTVLRPRFSGGGWLGLIQAAAPILACPDGSARCAAPALTDVDSDQSTVDSSRAALTIPPGAVVSWAGLVWAADGATGDPAHCAGARDGSQPPTPP